jgi:putative addiction module antidote
MVGGPLRGGHACT